MLNNPGLFMKLVSFASVFFFLWELLISIFRSKLKLPKIGHHGDLNENNLVTSRVYASG